MGHPADTVPKTPAAFSNARLSPEEAERLAATFRPSWELDDAPFTGPGAMAEADFRALQDGGGTHSDVRVLVQTTALSNGVHGPAAPAEASPPVDSSILDDSAPTAHYRIDPVRGATILGMAAPAGLPPLQEEVPAPLPPPPPPAAVAPISQRPPAPSFHLAPPGAVRARAVTVGVAYPKKSSSTGLWVGLGVGGVVILGLVAWMAAGRSGNSEKSARPAAATETTVTADKLSAISPPPPATTAAAVATVAPPSDPPSATVPAAPALVPIPTPVTALPQPTPVSAHPPAAAAAPAPRPNYGFGQPHPGSKPKGGQTIVRDVPF